MPQRILSISGLRGIVGDGLEPGYLVDFASALGTMYDGGTVILSRDGRSTGPMVKHAVLAGLLATGCRVLDADIASTPTCGVLVQHLKAAGGLQITASHNPIEWNGLKPFGPGGSVFDQARGEQLIELLRSRAFKFRDGHHLGTIERLADPHAPHLDRVLALVDATAIRARKPKVVLDCTHGSGGLLGPRLLETLGCEVHVLGGTPDGLFEHTPEPTEQNLTGLCAEVRRLGADMGFAQDPDADRLAIVDENGRYIGEELTLALCVDHVLKTRRGPVVVNGSTSRVTADIAAKYGCDFQRSHVGEANVVAKMQALEAVIGGEGNGGLIEPKVGWVRDSFVSMAYVLAELATRRQPLSTWVAELPKYTIVKDKVTCDRAFVERACAALKERIPAEKAQEGDGLRLDWSDRWVQVRGSNTEPIVRVIAEAPDGDLARELCRQAMEIVRDVCDGTGS
ncbi:MAG: phosphoglucosamine mutase [Planctomycetota bacterium]|nr:phosphoglucosamine mutase [Planctomycetota bacterium]